ncbi:MAG: DUF748 domain-containing protein [Betaproteobacteria bacterium]
MATRAHILTRLRRFFLSLPFLIVAGLLVLYALAGFFLAPYLIRREIPRFAQEKLGAQAALAEARVNPFLLTVELKGFRLAEGEKQPLLAFDRFFVDLEAGSLFRRAWTFADIAVERPVLALDIDPQGELNLARVIGRLGRQDAKPPQQAEGKEAPPRVVIRRASIAGGGMTLTDRSDATVARAAIDPIAFELHDISTLPDQRGSYTLTARLPAGATLSWRGNLSLQPIASSGEIGVKDLKLATLWNFLRDELAVEEPGGALTLGLRYDMSYSGGALQAAANAVTLRAKELSVTRRGEKSPILALAEIDLPNGTIDVAKRSVHFPAFKLRGGNLALAIDADGALNWQGVLRDDEAKPKPTQKPESVKQAPWRVALDQVRVENLALRYADASRQRPLLVETDGATLELGMTLETGDAMRLALEKISLELAKPRIGTIDGASPDIAFDTARVSGGRFELASRSASIEAVQMSGGATRVEREASGALPITELFAAKTGKPDEGDPFDFSIGRVELSQHAISVSDKGTEPAIGYDLVETALKVEDISATGKAPIKFDVDSKMTQGGSLRLAGSFDRERVRAEGKLEVSRLALLPLEPLLARRVILKLASGTASANGRFTWSGEGKEPGVRYVGTAAIEGLRLNEPNGERFLSWTTLEATRMRLDSGRGRYAIEDMRLVEPGAKLVINKDRSVNVGDIFRQPDEPAPKPAAGDAVPKPATGDAAAPPDAKGEPRFNVAVRRVRVEKGALDFADLSLVIPFATQIRDLGGSIIGLSAEPGTRAGVKLEGQVEDYGLARVNGTINLFEPKAHTDLSVIFRNVHMTPLSPYSVTFAGRRIASGRLSLDLQYKLNNSQLLGENKILLEQFTLGERVESPTAVNLPLDLAIAILTDSQGRIDIAVPVQGNVDQPEFSYGHLVWQAIRTLITRVVTAPFRALGSLFGGETEALDDVAFDAGSARLLPPEREKLVKLAETLKQRPQLKLVVQGRFHPARDGAALREAALRRAIAEQLEMKLAPGEDPGPVLFGSARTQRALEALLVARSGEGAPAQFAAAFGKERGREASRINPLLGRVGRASQDLELYEAMYRRLIELQPLPDAALAHLARERSAVIVKQLASAGLEAGHLGEKEPEPSSDAVTAKLTLDVARTPGTDAPRPRDDAAALQSPVLAPSPRS